MDENRRASRRRVLKSATIDVSRANSFVVLYKGTYRSPGHQVDVGSFAEIFRCHGGKRGLKVDDYILAPSITGVSQNGEVPEEIRGKDHIYMVRNFVEAAHWAAHAFRFTADAMGP
jgi:hypothetical protein